MSTLFQLLDRLEGEHSDLRKALARLGVPAEVDDTSELAARLPDVAPVLGPLLSEHSRAENEELFPAIVGGLGKQIVAIFTREHETIEALRDELYEGAASGRVSAATCTQLCELLGSHMDREDAVLFPAARRYLAERD